jgi:MFS family permease
LVPLQHEIVKASFTQGFIEMREGFKFLKKHGDAARGIAATAIHRGGLTALTLTALLLERNSFNDPADSEAGLAGLSFVLSIAAIGFTLGAILAPYGVRKFGRHRWIKFALFASAVGPVFLIISRTQTTLSITAFLTALCGQSLKVTNDALVQSKIDDIYRGRVFAVYDVVVNSAIVTGGLVAAFTLPTDGNSPVLPFLVLVLYLLAASIILRAKVFFLPTT